MGALKTCYRGLKCESRPPPRPFLRRCWPNLNNKIINLPARFLASRRSAFRASRPLCSLRRATCGAVAAFLLSILPPSARTSVAQAAGIPSCPAHFITSICHGPYGGIWLATEGHGVLHYNAASVGGWQQFDIGTAVNHNIADAVARDAHGRIWVGSLNDGVFVFLPSRDAGQPFRCRRYGLLTDRANDEWAGPVGEHVYSISVDPVDASVWICTSSGISRYEPGHGKTRGRWVYYDLANGLPSDDVQCVAFGLHGRAYVATTCNGIAIGRLTRLSRKVNKKALGHTALHYGHWRVVASRFTHGPPLTPTGRGLPSNLINAIVTTHAGAIWAATDEGIAWSTDHGRRWSFLRGANWAAKDAGLIHPPSAAFIMDAARRVPRTGTLSSDYCTALAVTSQGYICVGHRRTGLDIINPRTGFIWRSNPAGEKGGLPHRYVDAILLRSRGGALLGCYGGGLENLPAITGIGRVRTKSGPTGNDGMGRHHPLRFPAAATAPTAGQIKQEKQQLAAMISRLAKHKRLGAVALDTDWRTEGNWLGRYGDFSMILAAGGYESSLRWGEGWDDPQWNAWSGPHPGRSDGIRRWIEWLFTSDRRVLELPKPYFLANWLRGRVPGNNKSLCRRESEWDDHGEAYSATTQGPGLYLRFDVPPGVYLLAMYFYNYNGHSGPMRFRDFPVTLSLDPSNVRQYTAKQRIQRSVEFYAFRRPGPSHVVATARIAHFYGGQWVRFLIRGPNLFTVHLGRNYSLNTMLPCASISLAESRPPPYFFPFPTHQQCRYGNFVHHKWVPQVPPKPKIKSGYLIPIGRYLYEHYQYPAPAELIAWAASTDLWAGQLRLLYAKGRAAGGAVPALPAMHLFYRLHRYRRMERVQTRAGFLTARRIEIEMPWIPGQSQGVNALGSRIFQNYMDSRGYYRRQRRAAKALSLDPTMQN